jgi:outer membrane protein
MSPTLILYIVFQSLTTPQLPPAQGSTPPGQTPGPVQGPVPAFPGTPVQKPARVKDIAAPPPIPTPGSATGQIIGENTPLTADESVRIALHQQPSLGLQVGAIQTQQGQTKEVGAPLHPIATVQAGYDNVQAIGPAASGAASPPEAPSTLVPEGVSPVYPYSVAGAAKQLLFDFNMTRNLVNQSEALERAAEQNLTTAQLSLALNVKTDFYNYVSAIRLVHVNDENLANRQRELDLASARYKSGVGEPSDLATAQTSKSQGIFQLNQARDTAEHARISLLQQMGVDPLTPVLPLDEAAPVPVGSNDAHVLTSRAIRQRPEVRGAVFALAAAKYGLSAARATNLPALYAEVGADLNGNGFPLTNNAANFGIGFQFPVLDGGQREGAVRVARGQITTATSNYNTAVLQVRTDVANAYMSLRSAEQRVVIAANEVFNAREDVRVAEGRYLIGIGLFQDITTAEQLLLSALTDQESARNELDLARTQLQRATGELLKQ